MNNTTTDTIKRAYNVARLYSRISEERHWCRGIWGIMAARLEMWRGEPQAAAARTVEALLLSRQAIVTSGADPETIRVALRHLDLTGRGIDAWAICVEAGKAVA